MKHLFTAKHYSNKRLSLLQDLVGFSNAALKGVMADSEVAMMLVAR
ncbi:MAG: hypothetical protein AAF847_17565 [Bacteroidota bacterium]